MTGAGSVAADAIDGLALGRAIYNFRCYFCHGYSGDARTLAASYLTPPPRSFVATSPGQLSRDAMRSAVTSGKPGTAMMGFSHILGPREVDAVVDFVRAEFMVAKAENTRYHTQENGWPDHAQYAPAFPFARGDLLLDTPWEQLTEHQQLGKRIFLSSCVSCHDRARVGQEGAIWESRAVSYPRNGYSNQSPDTPTDGVSRATPYAQHEHSPVLATLSSAERAGERLFQDNCAFCHARDGTGKNWIGSFLEPHPRNLTSDPRMNGMTRARLREVIRDGLPGTTMSAWKSVLSEEQIANLIDYIHRAFHPLAGEPHSKPGGG